MTNTMKTTTVTSMRDSIGVVSRNDAEDFIIKPDPAEGTFGGLRMGGDITGKYVDAYIKKGRYVGAGEIISPEEDLEHAVVSSIVQCGDDKDDGNALFRFRLGEALPPVSVSIPGGVTKIVEDAFSGCTSLSAVIIPEGVTKIGKKAFEGCEALAEIHYAGSKEQWYAVKKGEDWNKDVPATDVLVRKS